jgi:hypothetical protein
LARWRRIIPMSSAESRQPGIPSGRVRRPTMTAPAHAALQYCGSGHGVIAG